MAYNEDDKIYDKVWGETDGLVMFNADNSEVSPVAEEQQHGVQTLNDYQCGGAGGGEFE